MFSSFFKAKSTHLLLLLLWLAALLTFAPARTAGGLDVDSCNYAVVAKEILRTHQWLGLYDPVIPGRFYYHFPLAIWVSAIIFKLFGISSFTAKLFSMFCGLALVACVFYLGRLLKNQWVGFFAALSLLMTNHITRLSMQCRMDIPVSLFIGLAIFSFILAQRHTRWYYLAFGAFSCLAIFTKDVVGLFPIAIAGIYLLFRLKWREFFQPLFIAGLVVAFAPVALWIRLDQGALFFEWWRCNFLHLYRSPAFNIPWYYYIQIILTKYYYFLPFALFGAYLAIKEAKKKKNFELLLLLIWMVIFPLAFSFGRQKLHYFILPMYPAASLLVGLAFERILPEGLKGKVATVFGFSLIIPTVVLLFFPLNLQSKHFRQTVALAPVIDGVCQQLADYEFLVYRQDVAALLFYAQQLSRVKRVKEKEELEQILFSQQNKTYICYLSEEDFKQLSLPVREKCSILVSCKDKILLTNKKELKIRIDLPD